MEGHSSLPKKCAGQEADEVLHLGHNGSRDMVTWGHETEGWDMGAWYRGAWHGVISQFEPEGPRYPRHRGDWIPGEGTRIDGGIITYSSY